MVTGECKVIKMYDGIEVTINDETKYYPDMEAYDVLRIPESCRLELTRALIGWRQLDITQAYNGYYDRVFLKLVPSK